MQALPDYRPDLDLYLLCETGEVACFCTLWIDQQNGLGMLEPVGTLPQYRRQGLAKALIYQGLNRLGDLGAIKAHVGSDQPFYLRLGFSPLCAHTAWVLTTGADPQ